MPQAQSRLEGQDLDNKMQATAGERTSVRFPSGRFLGEVDWTTALSDWQPTKPEMDAMLLGFFLHEGYGEVAQAFCQEAGLQPPTPEELHLVQQRYVRSLE
jgi:hypothetical protein